MTVLLRDELDRHVHAAVPEDPAALRQRERREARPPAHGHGDLGQILGGSGDGDERDEDDDGEAGDPHDILLNRG